MKILITGSHGTVGKAMLSYLQEQKIEVVCWDRKKASPFHYHEMKSYLEEIKPDALFHFAIASQGTGVENEGWKINYDWTSELAWLTKELGIKFLFTSTVMVFGDFAKGPFTLASLPDAKEGYGLQKLKAEERAFAQNPNSYVVRLGWQIAHEFSGNNMLAYLEHEQKEKSHIKASKHWYPACSFVDDTVKEIYRIAFKEEPGLYMIDSNDKYSFFELVQELKNIHKRRWTIKEDSSFLYEQRMSDPRTKIKKLSERLKELTPINKPTKACPRLKLSSQNDSSSRIIAGMWRMDQWGMTRQERLSFIEECLDLGVTSFDHADIYGDYRVEGLFGEALALNPLLRKKMQLTSKCGIKLVSEARPEHRLKTYDTSEKHIMASVENSLRNLQTNYLDTLLIHRPDPLMNFEEVAETFLKLRQSGKVLNFGVSNFSSGTFDALHAYLPLITNQIEFSPLHLDPLENGLLDHMQAKKIHPTIWSPLAAGRIFSENTEPVLRLRVKLEAIASAHNCSVSTVIFAWIMKLPSQPLPITGTSRIEGIQEAIAATELDLSREEWYSLLEAARGEEVA